MPRKKGGRSGTPDGYAPSPLGGDDPRASSPLAAPDASSLPDDDAAPVPSWSGLSALLPAAPRAATLEPTPVATGIGAHVHALLSPKLMTAAALGAGDWVALAVVASANSARSSARVIAGGGAGVHTTPGTPRTPPSARAGEGAGEGGAASARHTPGSPRTPGAHRHHPPALDAPVLRLPAILARRVPLDAAAGDGGGGDDDAFSDAADDPALAPGRHAILARVHPNPRASAPAGVALAKKIWLSLGAPAGGADLRVYPLEPPGDDETDDARERPERPERPGESSSDARAVAGRSLDRVALRLVALEPGVPGGAFSSSSDWLARGLADRSSDSRQRSVLEALARRALDGRGLLPGNLARLPLLGAGAYFEVLAEGFPSPEGGSGGGSLPEGTPLVVDRERTIVRLEPPREEGPNTRDARRTHPRERVGNHGDEKKYTFGSSETRASDPYAGLGGVEAYAAALHELVALPLTRPDLFASCGVRPPRGALLWGPPGTGKTRLARAAAAAAGASSIVVRGPELIRGAAGESEAALVNVFREAERKAPCVVILDELDALAPARGGGDGLGGRGGGEDHGADAAMSARVVAALLSVMDGAGPEDAPRMDGVVCVATSNRPDAIDRALRRPGRFDREIEVGVPGPAQRRDILRARLRTIRHELRDEEADAVAKDAHGFVGADVAALVREAAMEALRRHVRKYRDGGGDDDDATASATEAMAAMRVDGGGDRSLEVDRSLDRSLRVTLADFVSARRTVRPSALREVAVEVPKVSWSDVGGLEEVKARLREATEWAETRPDAMARLGATPPRGTLLYGPPGCSKTMLAKAVASEGGRNFLTIKGPELYSKWVGESEKAVRALFGRAKQSAPSVVFLDELDGLVGARTSGGEAEGGGGPDVHDRLLAQLLQEMDGLQHRGVAVMAATNRPDLVDPALLRPGRFDRLVYIPPPATPSDRAAIFAARLRDAPVAGDVSVEALGLAHAGYTGADIAAVCREAALAAIEERADAAEVAARHFAIASGRVKPSPPPSAATRAAYAAFERAGG